MTNSSSAIERRSSARARGRRGRRCHAHRDRGLRLGLAGRLASRGQLVAHDVAAGLLERAIERRLEQVRVVEVDDVGAPDDPQPDALLAPAVQLAGVVGRQHRVGRHDAPAVTHRVAVLLLAEDLPRLEDRRLGGGPGRRPRRRHAVRIAVHAAAATPRIASRTQRVSSRASRRNSRRDCGHRAVVGDDACAARPSPARRTATARSRRRSAGRGPGSPARARGCAARRWSGTPGAAPRRSWP